MIGLDNLNDYYDPALKQARLARLEASAGFSFDKVDVADREAVLALATRHPEIEVIARLAAQAGARHSLIDPHGYVRADVDGHLVLMELARGPPHLENFVYAISSRRECRHIPARRPADAPGRFLRWVGTMLRYKPSRFGIRGAR